MVYATISYVEASRRRTIHRAVTVDGVTQTATERCNLDDADFPPHAIETPSDSDRKRLCGWCFPEGLPQ